MSSIVCRYRARKTSSGPGEVQQGPGVSSSNYGPSTFSYLWLWTWSPAGRPRVVGNAPAFVDELRGFGGGNGAFVACCRPSPGCCGVSPCACLGAQYFSMKAWLVGCLMTLLGGDGHSVELTEVRNQSWKPRDPIGLLRVQWVFCGRDPCKQ